MAEFTFDGYKVYYETYGTAGEPLIILNGIMMSTASWKPFLEEFSKNNVVVLVDFLDQGQSHRMEKPYDHIIANGAVRQPDQCLQYFGPGKICRQISFSALHPVSMFLEEGRGIDNRNGG